MKEEILQRILQKYKESWVNCFEQVYSNKWGNQEETDKFLNTNTLP